MPVEEVRHHVVAGKHFVIALEPEDGGGFHVWCPELRGCHSFGVTEEEAVDNIVQTIGLYLNELVARYGQVSDIVIIPGEDFFPDDRPIPVKTLRAIADDLGVSLEELAGMADGTGETEGA